MEIKASQVKELRDMTGVAMMDCKKALVECDGDIEKALDEAYRVLDIGGRIAVLEFGSIPNDLLQTIYDKYSFNIIPKLGEIVAGDKESYQYLVESIRKFPEQEKFSKLLSSKGFQNVKYRNLSFGIVAIHSGWKI